MSLESERGALLWCSIKWQEVLLSWCVHSPNQEDQILGLDPQDLCRGWFSRWHYFLLLCQPSCCLGWHILLLSGTLFWSVRHLLHSSTRTRTTVYEWRVGWTPTKRREAEHPETIKGMFCPKELTLEWDKQAYQQPFPTEEVGAAEEARGGESGQFPVGLAKCFVFAWFLLGLQLQAVTAFITKKGTQIKSDESRRNMHLA